MRVTFQYGKHQTSPRKGRLIARVRAGIASREELFSVLNRELRFPSYFGRNWDALSDLLRDFHWVDEHEVVIVHDDLPNLPAEQLRTYLDILAHAVADWERDSEHELIAVFPEEAQGRVRAISALRDIRETELFACLVEWTRAESPRLKEAGVTLTLVSRGEVAAGITLEGEGQGRLGVLDLGSSGHMDAQVLRRADGHLALDEYRRLREPADLLSALAAFSSVLSYPDLPDEGGNRDEPPFQSISRLEDGESD